MCRLQRTAVSSASIEYVRASPANFSLSLFAPSTTGMAARVSANSFIAPEAQRSASASSAVSCAVCPSCQRNSVVRRNGRVTFSHRTTLAH